ncbi:MAG TPA: glycosyltransferase, partial [Archaeoglobaceae archaeon]|nr:glycosyltransferase [Archaeoglobaceae archaeon]
DMLLDVAERIDAKFLMIGKNLSELEKEAERRRIENKFIFLGFVKHEEVPKFISAADVCVAPYKLTKEMGKHGFYFSPIKIFEYMACGKPVVASDLEIIRGIIENKCGLLAKPNAEDFAEKTLMLLKDVKLSKKLGESSKKAVKKYTWDKVVDVVLR